MPRHEIKVERIPDEFQGKPVRLPDPFEMLGIYTRTVAEFRANYPILQQLCPSCDLSFDMSSLAPIFDAWGPDAVITVSLSCHWVPGEPRPKLGELPKSLDARAKKSRKPGGSGPNAAEE